MSEKRDPFDGEYIGSVFGPKITLYGGLLILFFTAVIAYRHWALDVPFRLEEPAAAPADSTGVDTLSLPE